MSDITTTDAAIETLRERERQLNIEIDGLEMQARVASAVRSEIRDLIGTFSRKPRARRSRAVDLERSELDAPTDDVGSSMSPYPTAISRFQVVKSPSPDEAA